nr:hypothetical protein [Anaerolineaceae bacterium]
MALFLGIDIGTTATKGLILDSENGVITESERRVALHSPSPGWAEEDPQQWWHNLCQITNELVDGRKISAIG